MNDAKKQNLPNVSVDVGLNASFEVKTEIPKEDTGRLVAALTDIIRPFTERRGLRADLIRLQREDVALEMVRRARQRLAEEQVPISPVPIKTLVPLLEKASLETEDKGMQERWATLLVSASMNDVAEHRTFIDILSRVSSEELRLLEGVCFASKDFPEMSYPVEHSHVPDNRRCLQAHKKLLMVSMENNKQDPRALYVATSEAYQRFVAASPLVYGKIVYAGVETTNGSCSYYYGDPPYFANSDEQPIEILQRERLVELKHLRFTKGGCEVGYFDVTNLGIRFVRDCAPQAREAAEKNGKAAAFPKPSPKPKHNG